MSLDKLLSGKVAQVIKEHFEKIQFSKQIKGRGRKKKVIAERPTINVDAADLTYAYS